MEWPACVNDAVCYLSQKIAAGDYRNVEVDVATVLLKEACSITLNAVRDYDNEWKQKRGSNAINDVILQRQNDMDAWWLQLLYTTPTVENVRGVLICPQFDELDGREMSLEKRIKTFVSALIARISNLNCIHTDEDADEDADDSFYDDMPELEEMHATDNYTHT